jgi:RimJ/RimL family protein N-acetyltransferase
MDQSNVIPGPFAIITPRLVIIPTPVAVNVSSYRALYSDLHADAAFCEMGFGPHFPARRWSDEETRDVIQSRDIDRCWKIRGLGDFAVGFRPPNDHLSEAEVTAFQIIKDQDFLQLAGPSNSCLEDIKWAGYAGVRDATTTSMPPREPGDLDLPPWTEMIEIRYGVSPRYWGKGIAKEASQAVMQWSATRGIKRFIAETEKENTRSAGLLQKLGFTLSGTNYWKEPSEIEWHCDIN